MKVLVAEGDAVTRQLLDSMLSGEGHDVILAENGDMAWKIIESHPDINVCVLGWVMAGRNGISLCRAIRASERDGYPYVILLTSDDRQDFCEGLRSGADDVLPKPPSRELLAARLEVARRIVEACGAASASGNISSERQHLDKLKSAFIRLISHEVRSPLVVLDGMLRLLDREIPKDNPALRELVSAACSSSERLSNLLCRTLKISENGEFADALERHEVDLTAELRSTLSKLRTFSDRRDQVLSFPDETPPCVVEVDSDKIVDAIINLVMNAIKFSPNGGAIQVELRAGEEGARVSVTDSGTGIRLEDQAHVWDTYFSTFDMLHHSSGAYEYQKRGIGLGLAIVKQFIALHGGTVGFDICPGGGTTFYFVLPAACVSDCSSADPKHALVSGSGV